MYLYLFTRLNTAAMMLIRSELTNRRLHIYIITTSSKGHRRSYENYVVCACLGPHYDTSSTIHTILCCRATQVAVFDTCEIAQTRFLAPMATRARDRTINLSQIKLGKAAYTFGHSKLRVNAIVFQKNFLQQYTVGVCFRYWPL